MQTYVRVNNQIIPATIAGRLKDKDWNDRPSKSIHLNLSYDEVKNLFQDDVKWEIGQEIELPTLSIEDDELTTIKNKIIDFYDNSEYSIVGDIILHADGTTTIKMGCPTSEELLTMIMEGIDE